MQRYLRSIAVAAAVLAALAAATTGASASDATQRHAARPTDFSGTNLVISRWAGDPWQAATTNDAAAWAKLTGASVSVDALPYENLQQKQVLALSSGGDYDIVYVHPSWFGQYAKAGYLAPIGTYMNDASLAVGGSGSSTFLPAILKQGAYNGQQYCLQDFVGTDLLAYRTDVFKANHLKPPVTTADVIADAKLLNGKKGMAGISLPGKRTGRGRRPHELAARRARHLVVQPERGLHAERREGDAGRDLLPAGRQVRPERDPQLPRRRGGHRGRAGQGCDGHRQHAVVRPAQ
jgi:multiple sugar transport system substrate-binding protein